MMAQTLAPPAHALAQAEQLLESSPHLALSAAEDILRQS
ncbi:MAG: hypothetical protein RIS85_501, partial [Pseudomonadota bacterium]